jgi:DNA-directed RNA polymerase subunit RPC12/RpoP
MLAMNESDTTTDKTKCPWCGKKKDLREIECDDCRGKEHAIEL